MLSRQLRSRLVPAALALSCLAPASLLADDARWWSTRALESPPIPALTSEESAWARGPVDAFVAERRRAEDLAPSPRADRRTLIRRLSFTLRGLPPRSAEIDEFLADEEPEAWERLVDRYLASPRRGERWARHWLDVAHYADTHGYDKDKLRPNAWPYRDYVVRSFNDDTTWPRFIEEQIAGDALFPGSPDGVIATGFLAAGPWDFIGHAEVPETKIDGKIARLNDRDDMVSTAIKSFTSTTAECARCHDHKFDPITQEDYYGLQAVFAAIDRADRTYDADPSTAARRETIARELAAATAERDRLRAERRALGGEELADLEQRIERTRAASLGTKRPEFGYHSAIEPRDDIEKWVEVDLGSVRTIERIRWMGCDDDFAGIGAGFGYPRRFHVEIAEAIAADGDESLLAATRVFDATATDVPNPGVVPQTVSLDAVGSRSRARYVRFTATRLAERSKDYIFALAELEVLAPDGENLARGALVRSLDSIEAPVRWRRSNLVDGIYAGQGAESSAEDLRELETRRDEILEATTSPALRESLTRIDARVARLEQERGSLPPPSMVYAGTVHTGSGAFLGTGHDGGRPREIRVLARGDVTQPGELAVPGALSFVEGHDGRFDLAPDADESARRVALARWISSRQNALTWRSIANRVWQHLFTEGLVDTPNDFGRMGATPSHPELLEWLAASLRDGGGSIKSLERAILTSATWQQVSRDRADAAEIDGGNRLLWRSPRRRLDAESVRDTLLAVSDDLNLAMYGPGFRDFVLEKPEHSPHYEYHTFDVSDPSAHRRAIYRFIVRSQPEPFLTTLDCADPSQQVGKRDETNTALQALALLNHPLAIRQAKRLAHVVDEEAPGPVVGRVERAFERVLCRRPTPTEGATLAELASQHGLEFACRTLLNLNELVFVD